MYQETIECRHVQKTANPRTNTWWSKVFKATLKSKFNHLKRLEIKGEEEILASQGFDHGRRLTYRVCVYDIPLHN